jgi:hypothetical protein
MPAALAAADQFMSDPVWSAAPGNPEQAAWLESFRRRAGLASNMEEIHRNATESAADHVAWLKSEGWDAQITQGTEKDIFLASTLNIVAKWKQLGRAYDDHGVDRVLLKTGAYTSPALSNERPVVEVVTQHPRFSFCFQQVDAAPASRAELADRALNMASRSASDAIALDFPMVDMLVRDDAKYMIGLRSGLNVVTQAAEQLRLELNEVGGRASAAAEVAVTRGAGPRTVKIDGPFIVAINRNGAPVNADKVVFAAYVDRDAWRKPASGRI